MVDFKASFKEKNGQFSAKFNQSESTGGTFGAEFGQTQIREVGDYEKLSNKPRIEGNTLIGDQTFVELGLGLITPQEIDDMFDELIYGG